MHFEEILKGASHCPLPSEVHKTDVVDVDLNVGTSVGTPERAFVVVLTVGDKLVAPLLLVGLGVGRVVTGGSEGARVDPSVGGEGSDVDTEVSPIGLLPPGHGKNSQSFSGFLNTLAPFSQKIRSCEHVGNVL